MTFFDLCNIFIGRRSGKYNNPEPAELTALKLLSQHLTRQQRRDFAKHRRFMVRGNVTGFEYWVHPARSFNITRLHDDMRLCAVPRNVFRLPIGDVMLTLKLTIENDEREFIRAAWGPYDRVPTHYHEAPY